VVAVGRARAHDYLREIGADVTIDHTSGDPVAQIAAAVGKVDALLDLAGGDVIPRGLPLIRSRGRAASIAALAGDLDLAIDQNLTVHGVLVRPDGARLRTLARLAGNGALRVRVRSEYPLDQASAAHREVARGGIPGKTVLRARPEPAAGSDENR
jgi:NADPH:quinone reductase-like Zn-dependent oxidoreductase